MQPFVVDTNSYIKSDALKAAVTYVEAFLDLNGITHVKQYLWEPDDIHKPPGKNPWHNNGWYWRGKLFVNLKRSRVPVKVPGFAWSYTGFKADLTAPGILAHETGHHIHFKVNKLIGAKHTKIMNDCIRTIARTEAPVSSYEPNQCELLAEAMRLFILNPKLLEEGRPKRYEFLSGSGFGLRPLHDAPWRDVLCNAHPRLIKSAENWIKR